MNPIQIVDRQSGAVIDAELICDLSEAELVEAERLYRSARVHSTLLAVSSDSPRPENSDWDWSLKALNPDASSCRFFAIRHNGSIEGLLMLNMTPVTSRLDDSKRVLYIEYIETAPWNQRAYAGKSARYGGIGTQLLRIAIQSSLEAGCEGRIALHSLPQSEQFYRPIFSEIGIDADVDLRYFEMDEKQSQNLLRGESL
jgi:hypothetical protein